MDLNYVLKTLCEANGVSGEEKSASEAACELLKNYADNARVDVFGNVTAFIGEKDNGKETLLLTAHIDEIGLVVSYIDDKGFIKVGKCGGIDPRLLAAQSVTVWGKKPIKGVISTLPPHVNPDTKKAMKLENAAIDTGYSKKQLEKTVSLGDKITFDSQFASLLHGRVTGKALDDRCGVAAILYALELLKGRKLKYNLEVLFAVQEEVSGKGAKIGSYTAQPDLAIAVDVSFGATPDAKPWKCGKMGDGAMIGIAPSLSKEISSELTALAKARKIRHQIEVMGSRTGTDADDIGISRGGVRTGLISIPQKYMHTPVEMVETADVEAAGRLIAEFADSEGGIAPLAENSVIKPVSDRKKYNDKIISRIAGFSYINGISGDEKEIRDKIISGLPEDVSYSVDNIGNLIVEKKGKKTPKNKLMICAHMDEVGFIVTHITEGGYLRFETVGGITPAVIFGRQVVFSNGTMGVIAAKPVHLLEKEEEENQPKPDSLYIDIGADSREEAEKAVSVGDGCCFASSFFTFGDGFVKGRALDDRVGCAIMLDMLKSELKYDTTFVFTVQEEIGTRGAAAAVYTVKPDMAIVLETTTACDIADSEGEKQVCILGNGVVASFMDRGTIYDKELYRLAFEAAEELGEKCQTKTVIAGGNDSAAIHKAVGGVRTIALSLPCRYLHSPACVIKEKDLHSTRKVAEKMLEKMGGL